MRAFKRSSKVRDVSSLEGNDFLENCAHFSDKVATFTPSIRETVCPLFKKITVGTAPI